MRLHLIAVWLGVLLPLGLAEAKPTVDQIQPSHGLLGSERKSQNYYPFDEVFYRFRITGLATDADGRVQSELEVVVSDANGKKLFDKRAGLKQVLTLGGGQVQAHAALTLGPNFLPGTYTFSVRIYDLVDQSWTLFERKFECQPIEFALIALRFFYDVDGKVPAPPGGKAGQTLHYQIRAIGVDRSQNKLEVEMLIQVLDAQGKETLPKPIRHTLSTDKPEEVKMAVQLNLKGALSLNRPGDFTLRITVTDKVAQKTQKVEVPLKVTEP